jgi:uncharacterized protein
MKFLLLLLVVIGAVAWLAIGRRRPPAAGSRSDDADRPTKPAAPPGPASPQAIVACAHCGVHLPAADALRDAEGRVYCSDAHRQAGPRSAG